MRRTMRRTAIAALPMKRFSMTMVSAAVLLAAFGDARPAQAQTVYGPAGLFVHPSAFVPERSGLMLNVSWFSQTTPGRRTEWVPISVSTKLGERAQAGALLVERRAGSYRSSVGAFGKYQIMPQAHKRPAVAVAASLLTGDVEQSSLSLAASHRFRNKDGEIFTAHVGGQWVRRDDIPNSSAQSDIAAYYGFEIPIGQRWGGAWRLAAETDSKLKFDRRSASAYGVMWAGNSGINVGVGYVNSGRSDTNRFFVGVGYPLGGGR